MLLPRLVVPASNVIRPARPELIAVNDRRYGAVPEVIDDGVSGMIVDDFDQLAGAVERARGLREEDCVATAKARFSPERMVVDYEEAYHRMIERR